KTTTCRLIYEILNACGEPCGNIGTLGAFFAGEKRELDLTTPDPEDFFAILKEMRDRGIKTVVTELSAHAIFYKKLDCVFFEALIFTNCTQDHLDFFRNMESYSKVKTSVFTDDKCLYKVINADDEYGKAIINKGETNVVSYGVKNHAEVFALKIRVKASGTSFFVNAFDSVEPVHIKLLGCFNVYNSLAAITFCALKGIDLKDCISALGRIEAVEGRLERVANFNGAEIFIDYAHTPDGLENALLTLSKITKNSLFCLFGCGGNRDKEKRAVMGRVAGDIADFVIVTSDNPRFEDPDLIIGEIVKGVREATLDYITISDRESAIRYAISLLSKGDVLLIAGKGAEEYQEVMGVKREFSDKNIVLKEMGAC
ncbi:MAG: UDP-N-acetylmuramoyl-L-alanyl-D-glutamate--2,6-diaminopimelate ligase, partial [Clostridia bacterium]|nr:UDP-N-acetylmuramoyl-L-alanyl-D-glutamate--2,6-diaminopimelate ligase [Clostridia bacterium]